MAKMIIKESDLAEMTPDDFRHVVRRGEWRGSSIAACRGYVQANVTILPKDYAHEFLLYCNRNPRPLPVIDVTEAGNPHPILAPEGDLRTDIGKYKVFKNGELIAEPTDVLKFWQDDLVAFLIGCSFSFVSLFQGANITFRYLGAYASNIKCVPAGRFKGNMVVNCYLFKNSHDAVRAIQITSRNLAVHGPPVHIGDPTRIGIKDLCRADFGAIPNVTPPQPDEIALYWGCGITPEVAIREVKPPLAITQGDSELFVTDWLSEELANL